jgi:DNA-binding response OmpR family regulator
MKLLLIEDEKELAESIKNYLTGNSFVCEWAINAKSAIDKISIYDYDCILLDLMLPDGNGFEILKELKKKNKTEGIIIISEKETLETRI